MKVFAIILSLILGWLCYYFGMPTLSFGFIGWPSTLMVMSIPLILLDVEEREGMFKTGVGIAVFGLFFLTIVPMLTSWSLFRSDAYKSLLGTVNEKSINSTIEPINPENIVIIDEQTAHRLADKCLNEYPDARAIGSEVELGSLTLQKVGDKMYYVAPLLHRSFFKWSSNSQGTPGYVMINTTNDKDVKFVQEVNGKKLRIKYQEGACFGDNIERHIYTSGYKTKGVSDYSFEVDDNGTPYYIATIYEKQVGYAGEDATGVITVDVASGEITEYSVKETPTWIDRIYPVDFIKTQVDDWGYFSHGWLNPSDKDRLESTDGISLVYGNDGQCYFYCGLTSVGKDQSSIGFLMINSRTKEVNYYHQGGATEQAAMASAEGKVQEKGYAASHPRPYNIDGIWTYVMALKDKEGLIKMVALVSVKNYDIVGVGQDIKDAIRQYKSALNSSGNVTTFEGKKSDFEVTGKITRFSVDNRSGNSYYYFMIDTIKTKIFVATSNISDEVVLTQLNDIATVTFADANSYLIDVRTFDNKGLSLSKSESQNKVEKYFKTVNDSISIKQDANDANALWDTLSESKKAEILKSYQKTNTKK
jgi:hypothetical protein